MQVLLDGITKTYRAGPGEQAVLANVSAAFDSGRFIAILGRSGSGKSTLLNLIGGIDNPDSGDIRFDAVSMTRADDTARALFRRRHIGFVFQFFNLLPTLSVAENILLPLELNRVPRAQWDVRLKAALTEVGLAELGSRFPEELSGGEQQRVAIARALIHKPSIVLADEPTGNLDLATARQVIVVLDDVCRRHGVTLIMATHSEEVVGQADEVYTVHNAKLERRPAP